MFDETDTLTADLDLLVRYPGGTTSSTVMVTVREPRLKPSGDYRALAWLTW